MYVNHLFRARILRHLLLVGILSALAALAPAARAGAISVTTTDDELNNDGDCSLREAIVAANRNTDVDACTPSGGKDLIFVPAGTYTLGLSGANEDGGLTGDLDILEDLAITGAGGSSTIIDAGGLDRAFHIAVPTLSTVELSRLTITGGDNTDAGGGLMVESGRVTSTRISVSNNEAAHGGGIFVAGTAYLELVESLVSDNIATYPASFGGGIEVEGTLHLVASLVDGNAAVRGGGLHTSYNGFSAVVNSTISGNSAESYGGGLENHGITTLYNVTIATNTADSDADDIGSGGGIMDSGYGEIYIRNSIVAANFDLSNPLFQTPDCWGTPYSYGYNLVEDSTDCTFTGITVGNITGINAGIGPLRNNGGPTLTHALRDSSPAIDAGNPGGCSDEQGLELSVDQRGFVRPVDGDGDEGALCDIGAFERSAPASPTPTATATEGPSPTPTTTETPGPSPTPTSTATQGPSPTPTSTVTPGPSPTPTITVTPGPSPTPTATFELPPGVQPRLYLPFFAGAGVQ